MLEWLKGKKTYLTAVATILWAILSYVLGKETISQAGDVILAALVAAGLRNGIAVSLERVLILMEKIDAARHEFGVKEDVPPLKSSDSPASL